MGHPFYLVGNKQHGAAECVTGMQESIAMESAVVVSAALAWGCNGTEPSVRRASSSALELSKMSLTLITWVHRL